MRCPKCDGLAGRIVGSEDRVCVKCHHRFPDLTESDWEPFSLGVEEVGAVPSEIYEEPASQCFTCRHYSEETESDGQEYPPYKIVLCDAKNEEGDDLWQEGNIENWPIEDCECFEQKEGEDRKPAELKPCPFNPTHIPSEEVYDWSEDSPRFGHEISCCNIKCFGRGETEEKAKETAIREWNNRPYESLLEDIANVGHRNSERLRAEVADLKLENARVRADNQVLLEHRLDATAHTEHEGYWFGQAQAMKADLARKDAEIARLDELIAAYTECLKAVRDNWSLTTIRNAYSKLGYARARLAEVRGESNE